MTKKTRFIELCRGYMASGDWWSIPQMASALGCTQCGASARIRDLRKQKFGGHTVVKRQRGGVFEYRMIPGKTRLGRRLDDMLMPARAHGVDRLIQTKEARHG